MNKLLSLDQAVLKFVRDRQTIAFAGMPLMRKPVIFAREILRQKKAGKLKVNDLLMAGGTASFGTALLVGAGLVESMIAQFIGFERAGLNYVIKKSIEQGLPRRVQVEDESNLTFNLRCLAGALNLPFIPSISGLWGDLNMHGLGYHGAHEYRKYIHVRDPFGTGRHVALIQGLKPDLTVMHAPMADAEGNTFFLGAVGHDDLLSKAGRQVVVVADHIVTKDVCRKFPNLVAVPSIGVEAIVRWKLSSWPMGCPGLYDPDIEHIKMFNETARRDEFQNYLDQYVYSYRDEDQYLDMIGKEAEKLRETPSRALIEPFRNYLIEESELEVRA
ncbi:MAG TPA: CoA-transferase [Candidatus Bathyarchaeia archaeon]|nr:CoA-transferase [Candidatus Bathyarchaeia archaeon]